MSEIQDDQKKKLLNLGAWMGRHQAFALVANRCSAADAESLKAIRDSADYKELSVTWEEFCVKYAGISRVQADEHIHCFEEYGVNYRRMAEIMSLTSGTFKLIAGAVSEQGLEYKGEYIPLVPENAARLAGAVKALRKENRAGKTIAVTPALLRKAVDKVFAGIVGIANEPGRRAELIVLVERAGDQFQALARTMREKTMLVE
jgi:hypothetical protein